MGICYWYEFVNRICLFIIKKINNYRNVKKNLSVLVSKVDCENDWVLLIG